MLVGPYSYFSKIWKILLFLCIHVYAMREGNVLIDIVSHYVCIIM